MRYLWSLRMVKVLVAFVLLGSVGATAAIVITYSNTTTLSTSATAVPIQFVAGADAGPSTLTDYVSAYAISTNKTYITVTVNGVPEASLTVGSFFKLQNVDDASHTVTLTTTQVSNAFVSAYTLQIYTNTDTLVDTLDLKAASPSASATVPAATTYYAKLTLTLASGATPGNVDLTNALSLGVSA